MDCVTFPPDVRFLIGVWGERRGITHDLASAPVFQGYVPHVGRVLWSHLDVHVSAWAVLPKLWFVRTLEYAFPFDLVTQIVVHCCSKRARLDARSE